MKLVRCVFWESFNSFRLTICERITFKSLNVKGYLFETTNRKGMKLSHNTQRTYFYLLDFFQFFCTIFIFDFKIWADLCTLDQMMGLSPLPKAPKRLSPREQLHSITGSVQEASIYQLASPTSSPKRHPVDSSLLADLGISTRDCESLRIHICNWGTKISVVSPREAAAPWKIDYPQWAGLMSLERWLR